MRQEQYNDSRYSNSRHKKTDSRSISCADWEVLRPKVSIHDEGIRKLARYVAKKKSFKNSSRRFNNGTQHKKSFFWFTRVSFSTYFQVQSLFREKAFHFLDALTFEILMSIDREMVSLNPIVANYTYVSPDFIKFIWSFKDVTLPKDR